MRLRIGGAIAVLVAATLAAAPAQADGPPITRILLTATKDPSTSQYISWSLARAGRGIRVEVTAPDGTAVRPTVGRKTGTTKRAAGSTQYRYIARLRGLQPDTTYTYRIFSNGHATRFRTFTTAPPAGGSFTFLQFGDTQIDNDGVPERIIDDATSRFPHAGLLLHAGDVVNHPWVAKEWSELARALSPSGQSASWMAAIGNHEQCVLVKNCRSDGGRGFRSYFQGPTNGFPRQRPTWYFSDVGAARFIVLDSFGKDLGRQRAFLRHALSTNTRHWSIVLMHEGPFASRGDRSGARIRQAFLPTLEQYGADLVLSGHDHSYARGQKAGVAYVVSDSGPKFYDTSSRDWTRGGATRVTTAYRTSTYQVVDVSPDALTVRAIVGHRGKGATPTTRVGDVLDTFTLTR